MNPVSEQEVLADLADPRPSIGERRNSARKIAAVLGGLLVLVTALVYGRVWRFDFISIDDPLYVAANPLVRNGLSWRSVRWALESVELCNWMPLTRLSLIVDGTFYSARAGGYHVTNVIFHVVNVLLVFAFFTRATGNVWRSAFVAGLFAVHPLHVESVAWIAERKDVLSQLFGLLALCAYVRYAQTGRAWRLAAAFALFILSLSAKQTLVTLPFLLLLLDYWPLGRLGRDVPPSRRVPLGWLVFEKLPFFAASAVFSALAYWVQWKGSSIRSISDIPLDARILNGVLAYALYLQKAVLPVGLAVFYPHPREKLPLAGVAVAFAFLAAVTLLAVVNARRRPYLIVGWFWYLGTLVPMIGLVQIGVQQMANRYAYFPLLGIYAATAWLVPALLSKQGIAAAERGGGRPNRWLPAAAAAAIAAYAAVAYAEVGYWRDGVTLMRRSLEMTEDSVFARAHLGDALLQQSRFEEAVAEFKQAIRVSPNDPDGYIRLGYVFTTRKLYDEAAEQYQAGLAVDEVCAPLHNGLGSVYLARRQFEAARREFLRALEIDPEQGQTYAYLAALSRDLGRYEESITCAQRALDLDRRLVVCHRLIAMNLYDLGKTDEAVRVLQTAVAQFPDDDDPRDALRGLNAARSAN